MRGDYFECLLQNMLKRISLSEKSLRKIMMQKLDEHGFTLRQINPSDSLLPEQAVEMEKSVVEKLNSIGL